MDDPPHAKLVADAAARMDRRRASAEVPEGVHAVFACDPGGTTGVAAGYIEIKPTFKQTIATLHRRKAIEVGGTWLEQSSRIAELMNRFAFTASSESGLPAQRIHFVFEDFVLRRRTEGGATGNLTSIWVAAATVGKWSRGDVSWVQASEAKSFATNERLKMWGLWEVGSEHRRDAWRHFAAFVNKRLVP